MINRRSFLLLSSLLATTILSAQANPFKNIKELESFLSDLDKSKKRYKSIPSPRTFYADSSHTAAGVLHYAIDPNEGPVILLGLRNDEETYCNLGGMSENNEENPQSSMRETLAQTASREAAEESNGYYVHHHHDLEDKPFIDTLRKTQKGSLFHRMYWKKVQKVEGNILLKASENSKHAHNKEYKDFIWVPVKKILNSVKEKSLKIKINENKDINLFKPLFQSLETDSGMAFLKLIAKEKAIPSFHELRNRLYLIQDKEDKSRKKKVSLKKETEPLRHANFEARWMLPYVSNAQRGTHIEILPSGKKVKSYNVPYVPFGKNAWGEEDQTLTLSGLKYTKKIPSSSEKDEKNFAYAVAAHGAAMVELKHRAQEIQRKARIEDKREELLPPVKEWNPKSDLTLSRIHLRMVLGENFKTAKDFPDVSCPQRVADIENLRMYLTTHKDVEFIQKKAKAEFKRQINFLEEDLETFADILDWEERHQHFPTFYHAANADINNLWQTFTYLREYLSLTPLVEEKIAMRGTDIYFRGIKTMHDILNIFGHHDYEKGRAALVLCANYVLTAGLQTTRTTSSSIEYFLNNHSVSAPDIEEKFAEATALAGIVGDYSYFRSLFLQHLAHRHPSSENSVMVGLAIPPGLLDAHSTTRLERGNSNRVLDILQGIQNEYESHKERPESFTTRKEEKRDLIPEARISLHPDLAFHPQVKMKAFNRFPLSSSEQKHFDTEMRHAIRGMIGDWLKTNSKIMPDSFVAYPSLKRLYNLAYEAITGQKMEEKLASSAFSHLIKNNHIQGVKEFVEKFPEILEDESFGPHKLIFAALRENKLEMTQYLFENLFKERLQAFFKTPKEFYKAVRVCLSTEAPDTLDYILSRYDLTKIDKTFIRAWAHSLDIFTETLKVFFKHFSKVDSTLLNFLFESNMANEDVINTVSHNGVAPQLIAETWFENYCEKISKGELTSSYLLFNFIKQHSAELNLSKLSSIEIRSLFKNFSPSDQSLKDLASSKAPPQLIAEEWLKSHHKKISKGKDTITYAFFGFIKAYPVDLSKTSAEEIGSLFESFSVNEGDLKDLIKAKVPAQLIAEEWLKSHHKKISKGKDTFSYAFFSFIKAYSVDLSKVSSEEINSLFESFSVNEEDLENLIKAKVPAQLIAEEWLKSHHEKVSKGKGTSPYAFFSFIKAYPVDLSKASAEQIISLNSFAFFNREVSSLINSKVSREIINQVKAKDRQEERNEKQHTEVLETFPFSLTGEHKPLERGQTSSREESLIPILKRENDFHPLTLDTLKTIYPSLEYFVKLHTKNSATEPSLLVSAIQENSVKSIQAIIEYVGDSFPNLMVAVGEDTFEDVLESLPDETIRNLVKKFPSLFTMRNDKDDFFEISLAVLPLSIREDFIFNHKNQLKNLNKIGMPYFWWCLSFDLEKNHPFIPQLIKEDPTFLEIKSLEGITLQEILDVHGKSAKLKEFLSQG